MDKDTFLEEMLKQFSRGYALVERKNHDYSGDTDAFATFSMCELAGITTTEQGILIRMFDKVSRVANLLTRRRNDMRVRDEAIDDTLTDIMNYAAIMAVYLRSKRGDGTPDAAMTETTEDMLVQSETPKLNPWEKIVAVGNHKVSVPTMEDMQTWVTIPEPHHPNCDCSECIKDKSGYEYGLPSGAFAVKDSGQEHTMQ